MDNVLNFKVRKQWYIKNKETKFSYTPCIETIGHTVLLKLINKRDFYILQELINNGNIPVVEVNTKETAKDLDA
jgi:hypothetical protein